MSPCTLLPSTHSLLCLTMVRKDYFVQATISNHGKARAQCNKNAVWLSIVTRLCMKPPSDITFLAFKQPCSFSEGSGEPKWQRAGVWYRVAHIKMWCTLLPRNVWYEISSPIKILELSVCALWKFNSCIYKFWQKIRF